MILMFVDVFKEGIIEARARDLRKMAGDSHGYIAAGAAHSSSGGWWDRFIYWDVDGSGDGVFTSQGSKALDVGHAFGETFYVVIA